MVVPTIIHLSDKRRIEFPDTYSPVGAISIGVILFLGFGFLALIIHCIFKLEFHAKAPELKKEIEKLDGEIFHYKRDFERFENFDEIGEEE